MSSQRKVFEGRANHLNRTIELIGHYDNIAYARAIAVTEPTTFGISGTVGPGSHCPGRSGRARCAMVGAR